MLPPDGRASQLFFALVLVEHAARDPWNLHPAGLGSVHSKVRLHGQTRTRNIASSPQPPPPPQTNRIDDATAQFLLSQALLAMQQEEEEAREQAEGKRLEDAAAKRKLRLSEEVEKAGRRDQWRPSDHLSDLE